jgi:predicted aspartyl protease
MEPTMIRRRPSLLTAARALLALLLGAAGGCLQGTPARIDAPADPAAGEVPFELVGPNDAAIVVSAEVNGEGPFDLVVDTGATFTCLDESLARRLELPDAPRIGFGAGIGGGGRMRVVEIESLKIGETTAHDLLGSAVDLQHLQDPPGFDVDGLLGLNLLKSFRVTLDFERQVLRLEAI